MRNVQMRKCANVLMRTDSYRDKNEMNEAIQHQYPVFSILLRTFHRIPWVNFKQLNFLMSKDNIGNFHDPGDFEDDDEEKDEAWKPENIFGKELFSKSIEILNHTETICSMLPEEEGGVADFTHRLMMENASIIPAKIKGAMGMDIYCLMMENAVIIKGFFQKLNIFMDLKNETQYQ